MPVIEAYQYQLKGISFLPKLDTGAYPQMPYEEIDVETYNTMTNSIGKLSFGRIKGEEVVIERFCDNDVCQIDFTPSITEDDKDVEKLVQDKV